MSGIDHIIARQRRRLEAERLRRNGTRALVWGLVATGIAIGVVLALTVGIRTYVERNATSLRIERSIYTEADRQRIARLFSQIDRW